MSKEKIINNGYESSDSDSSDSDSSDSFVTGKLNQRIEKLRKEMKEREEKTTNKIIDYCKTTFPKINIELEYDIWDDKYPDSNIDPSIQFGWMFDKFDRLVIITPETLIFQHNSENKYHKDKFARTIRGQDNWYTFDKLMEMSDSLRNYKEIVEPFRLLDKYRDLGTRNELRKLLGKEEIKENNEDIKVDGGIPQFKSIVEEITDNNILLVYLDHPSSYVCSDVKYGWYYDRFNRLTVITPETVIFERYTNGGGYMNAVRSSDNWGGLYPGDQNYKCEVALQYFRNKRELEDYQSLGTYEELVHLVNKKEAEEIFEEYNIPDE